MCSLCESQCKSKDRVRFARTRVSNFTARASAETPIWLNFWLVILNNQAAGPEWKFDAGEALALMGSHTLIDNQVRAIAIY